MIDSQAPPSGGVPPHHTAQATAATDDQEHLAPPPSEVPALLTAVENEIGLLRQRIARILTEHAESGPGVPSSQRLEDLVLDLREANENLVIATLDANLRETKTAESHRQQTLFLSMLAHELRNPLAPIAMGVELLGKMPELPPAIAGLQRILERQTSHLVRLVDDLMDATRINKGKLKIKKTAVLVSQFIEHAVETSQPQFLAQAQQLHLSLPPEPLWVHGDPVRLSQLFSNLLLNASKFSPDGAAIHLSGRREADLIVFSVKDEGIGIAPERQPFIFDLFNQGAVGEELMAKGLGIGLSLVRTIAQLHQGTVEVASRGPGEGSEFIVGLPVFQGRGNNALPEPALSSMSGPLERRRILLIDDNVDINQTLGEFLKEAGHDVDFALEGTSGLEMADARPYDVVCCDIGLPGINGYEVARQLQGNRSSTRLIAISGYDQPEQRRRALEAGFHHYLVKPISGDELLALIADSDE